MNPSVNRSSESPNPSQKAPKSSSPSNQSEMKQTDNAETIPPSIVVSSSEANSELPLRKHPIPPPSDPKQYRAIGLIQGRYQFSEEQLTQGTVWTPDGTAIDAVLLGRVLSLVKNHLDLSENHLWVVYPRTRQKDDHLHVQIVGGLGTRNSSF